MQELLECRCRQQYIESGAVFAEICFQQAGGHAEVEVKCYKSIDGTGILSVANEITALQNAVAQLNAADECVYKCNGADDNVKDVYKRQTICNEERLLSAISQKEGDSVRFLASVLREYKNLSLIHIRCV